MSSSISQAGISSLLMRPPATLIHLSILATMDGHMLNKVKSMGITTAKRVAADRVHPPPGDVEEAASKRKEEQCPLRSTTLPHPHRWEAPFDVSSRVSLLRHM